MPKFGIEEYNAMPQHEKSLADLVSSVSGQCSKDVVAADKSCTIRLTYQTYPQVKAIVDLSGNSLNTVVNDMLIVALGYIKEEMGEEALKSLLEAAEPIERQMLEVK